MIAITTPPLKGLTNLNFDFNITLASGELPLPLVKASSEESEQLQHLAENVFQLFNYYKSGQCMAHKDNGSEYNTPSVLGWLKMCIRVHQHFANGNQRHAKSKGTDPPA